MKRLMAIAIVVLSCAGLVGCGDEKTTASAESTFTVTPPVPTAVESKDVTYTIVGDANHPDQILPYSWKSNFTITITETAGVGRKITGITCVVQQATGGIVIAPTGGDREYYRCDPHASGNRIEAKGSANVSFDVWYSLPNKGRESLVTATFTFLDDNDASFTESKAVSVN